MLLERDPDEFGRASQFRAGLRSRKERYVLDVPCNTLVRDLERRRPPRKRAGVGRKREVPFRRADEWARGQPASRWERVVVRDGENGLLAAPGDADAIAAAIQRVVEDSALRDRLAAAAAPSVAELAPERIYARLETILERASRR